MRMAIVVFLACVWIVGARGAQQAPFNNDDRAVFEAVFEQIQNSSGSPALHKSRRDSEPIYVVDQARPICRVKRTDSEMPWPPQCAEDPLRLLKRPRNSALPEWLQPAGLTDDERFELVRSFETRNVDWQPIAVLINKMAEPISRARGLAFTHPGDVVMFSLPGYSSNGRAVVFAEFSCGSLCGTHYVVVLQRSGSNWTVVSRVVGLGVA